VENSTERPSEKLKGTVGITKIEQIGDRVVVYGTGNELAGAVVSALTSKGIKFSNLRTEQPNLEDVFLSLTGRQMEV
jgi:ABC-2 type transport system ATP-binding protein